MATALSDVERASIERVREALRGEIIECEGGGIAPAYGALERHLARHMGEACDDDQPIEPWGDLTNVEIASIERMKAVLDREAREMCEFGSVGQGTGERSGPLVEAALRYLDKTQWLARKWRYIQVDVISGWAYPTAGETLADYEVTSMEEVAAALHDEIEAYDTWSESGAQAHWLDWLRPRDPMSPRQAERVESDPLRDLYAGFLGQIEERIRALREEAPVAA